MVFFQMVNAQSLGDMHIYLGYTMGVLPYILMSEEKLLQNNIKT